MNPRLRLAALVLIVIASALAGPVAAQAWPSKPIRFVLPYSAGTGIDLVTRSIAQKMSEKLGQPVYVENRVGAGGNIGTELVAGAPPDGYNVLMVANTIAMNPSLYKLRFDPLKDFAPVGLVTRGALVLAVNPKVEARNPKELVATARATPGKLNYGSAGIGTPQHLAMELLKNTASIDMVHVPHKGAAEVVGALLAGHIDLMFVPLQSALPHIRSGKLRAIAVASPGRHAALPDTPTIAEALGFADFDVDLWYALLLPAQTPRAIVDQLNRATREILAMEDIRTTLGGQGMVSAIGSPEEFRALLMKDMDRWSKLIRTANIKAE